MKNHIFCVLFGLVLLSACASAATPAPATPTVTPAPTPTPEPTWVLVWTDEFEAPDGSAVDPKKWRFDTGSGGWGNNELQYYTDTTDNAYIEDGNLVIKAEAVDSWERYTSARLVTHGEASWVYGRFEIRAKLPIGQGIWPAIWMLPAGWHYGGWPVSGEIDIMEYLGHEPARVHGTLHYGNPHTYEGTYYDLDEGTFADDFHVFALEWEPEEIRWYVDDHLVQTQTEWFTSSDRGEYPAPFDKPFNLLINVAVGGQWPGNPDETTEFPQYMRVDYVRVYEWRGE